MHQFSLPLLAFQHHVGQLFIDPVDVQWVRELGNSDLAIVEQGRWKRADGSITNIVCKVWRPFVIATPQDFRELLLEASKLHRLQHPNITRFMGLGCFAHGSLAEVRESMFMVEEYVGQRTLRKLLSEQMRIRHRNLYDARTALQWAAQIASALAALHEQQPPYVHNDVKADNVFLTDAPRLAASDAKLGDLKPHRHVYDREPSTLSRHHSQQQQQQRLLARPTQPGSLPAPKYTLERCSGGSSACGEVAQASWGSDCSSGSSSGNAAAGPPAAAAVSQQQQQELSPPLLPQQQQQQGAVMLSSCFAATSEYSSNSWSAARNTGGVVDATAGTAPGEAGAAPAAAAAAAAGKGGDASCSAVTCARSLPVPITARSCHTPRGSTSCPTDWNPSLADSQASAAGNAAAAASGATAAGAPAADATAGDAVAYGSPIFHSVNSHSLGSFGSTAFSPLQNSSSVSWQQQEAPSSCRSTSLPLQGQNSLAAEVAAADAAAAAAAAAATADDAAATDSAEAAAAAGEGAEEVEEPEQSSGHAWVAVGWQDSASNDRQTVVLSDSASSTGGTGRASGPKAAVGSLAADVEAEDACCPDSAAGDAADGGGARVSSKGEDAAVAGAAAAKQVSAVVGVVAEKVGQSSKQGSSKPKQQQQQQQQPKRSSSGLFMGALATAFANAGKQGPGLDGKRQQKQQEQQAPQVQQEKQQQEGGAGARDMVSPWQHEQQQQQHYRRCKSSPLQGPRLQLASSAPDVGLHGSSIEMEEAVQHGSLLLMPLHLSEPTGLCTLTTLGSSSSSSGCNGVAAADGAAAAVAAAAGKREGLRTRSSKALQPPAPAAAEGTAASTDASAVATTEQLPAHHQQQQQPQQQRRRRTKVLPAAAATAEKGLLRHAHSQPLAPPSSNGANSGGFGSSGIGSGVGGPGSSSGNGCVYYGWELLPSGAASPCGAVQSSLLDLFADLTEDDITSSSRWHRDSCQYTLVPGSFVQQKAPLSTSASAPLPQRSKSATAAWDASAAATAAAAAAVAEPSAASYTAGTTPGSAPAANSKWTSSSLLHAQHHQQQQQQQQAGTDPSCERGPSVGKGCAPSAIESKQHGSNSAFAALTAIDCIAEEGSSIATDSCAPSASSSRESSAHAGSHFYGGNSSGGGGAEGGSSHSPAHAGGSGHGHKEGSTHGQSPLLLTASSLTKALSLSGLLRWGSSGSARTSSSGGRGGCDNEDEEEQNSMSSCSRSPPASPRSSAAAAAASAGVCSPDCQENSSGLSGSNRSSPGKRAPLQLLATAAGTDSPVAGSHLQQTAAANEGASAAAGTDSLEATSPFQTACPAAAAEGAEGAEGAAEPGSPTAAGPAKRVRFALTRPEGSTPSRDYSLLYAAPELVRGERPTEKVDVFAFGMMLYELLSRRLLASSVAAVCNSNSSRHRGSSKHKKQPQQQQQQQEEEPQLKSVLSSASSAAAAEADCGTDGACGSSSGHGGTAAATNECGRLPEHQLLLMYAQLVAGGYRPPMLSHFPEPVVRLISSCWAAEPHERPRMSEVLQELELWHKDRRVLAQLNNYVLALADMGHPGSGLQQPGCSCVIS